MGKARPLFVAVGAACSHPGRPGTKIRQTLDSSIPSPSTDLTIFFTGLLGDVCQVCMCVPMAECRALKKKPSILTLRKLAVLHRGQRSELTITNITHIKCLGRTLNLRAILGRGWRLHVAGVRESFQKSLGSRQPAACSLQPVRSGGRGAQAR